MLLHQYSTAAIPKMLVLKNENNNGLGQSIPLSDMVNPTTNITAEELIDEEDLYRYTRHRWMYSWPIFPHVPPLTLESFNEEEEPAKHYRRFDHEKLVDAAVLATRCKPKYCMSRGCLHADTC